MHKITNNKSYNVIDSLGCKKRTALMTSISTALVLALMTLSAPSFADKSANYGDINDEDGKYVSWDTKVNNNVMKVSQKSDATISVRTVTKKVTNKDLSKVHEAGYGDLNRDEE